jgi:hypothetical protein
MNRNIAILALAASIAAGLLIVGWEVRDGSAPSTPPSLPSSVSAADADDSSVLLERIAAPPEKQDDALALQPEVLAVKVERRTAVDEAGRISSRRNEPMRLVTGIVRDDAGRPVQGAVVLVTEACAPDPQEPRVAILASGGSDESGRFEIRTTVRPTDLQARASKSGYVDSAYTAFHPGASGLVLALDHGGIVVGRLLLDRWMKLADVTVDLSLPLDSGEELGAASTPRLVTAHGVFSTRTLATGQKVSGFPAHHTIGAEFEIDEDGRFVATGIACPAVELSVYLAGESLPAISIPDVAVRREGKTSDARLDPLDLRGKFELLAVDVLDESGNGLTGAIVSLSDAGFGSRGLERKTATTVFGGHAEFLTRAGPRDIEVECEGFQRARLDSVRGNQVVGLRKGIAVRVRVRGSEARPAPPDLLAVGFLGEKRDESMSWVRNVPFSVPDGIGVLSDPHETTFLVAAPGVHHVVWYLQHGKFPHYLETGSDVTVDVRDQDALQEFVLDLPEPAERAWSERPKLSGRVLFEEVR